MLQSVNSYERIFSFFIEFENKMKTFKSLLLVSRDSDLTSTNAR